MQHFLQVYLYDLRELSSAFIDECRKIRHEKDTSDQHSTFDKHIKIKRFAHKLMQVHNLITDYKNKQDIDTINTRQHNPLIHPILIDDFLHPPRSQLHIMVYSRLMIDSTAKACACDAYQGEPILDLCDQRSSRVTQAGVLSSVLVACTDHLPKQFHIYVFALVPTDALLCTDDRH